MAKIKTVGSISDFMAGKHNETWMDRAKEKLTKERIEKMIRTATSVAVPVSMGLVGKSAFAAPAVVAAGVTSETAQALILKAFDPLMHLIIAASYPIAGIMITGGCLLIMVTLKEMGVKWIMNASIGFILVQLSPLLLKLVVGIGTGAVAM